MDPEPCFREEEFLTGALKEVNGLDIQKEPDLQLCMRKVAKWLEALANGTWPANNFRNFTYQAANNVQTRVHRHMQGRCWNCGEEGHNKAQCPKPRQRLTDQ